MKKRSLKLLRTKLLLNQVKSKSVEYRTVEGGFIVLSGYRFTQKEAHQLGTMLRKESGLPVIFLPNDCITIEERDTLVSRIDTITDKRIMTNIKIEKSPSEKPKVDCRACLN